jgi:hypothetical protein
MRKLKIDLSELAFAFDNASFDMNQYLDLETGEVVAVDSETSHLLEELYEEMGPEAGDDSKDLDKALQRAQLPDWQRAAVRLARQVELGSGTRYAMVPEADSFESYRQMEDFIATVNDKSLRHRLAEAIQGRGAFARFKNVLHGSPGERERWFEFKAARVCKRMVDWLKSLEIDVIDTSPPRERAEPIPVRPQLLAEVLAFVQAARELGGITRIALVGSLTTKKPDPKDADLLVTVTAAADLEPLAQLGRRLQGRTQSFNRGGDVFLADPKGNYLGRTCQWRECRPGVRLSCDALHCGRRQYLHDDLQSITLDKTLIASPPVELWPRIVTRIAVPADVEELLLQPLKSSSTPMAD